MSDQKEIGNGNKPAKKDAKNRGKGQPRKPKKPKKPNLVDRMIKGFEANLEKGEVKVSVGEFIRLVQLRSDLNAEEPKEIRVTWVEPPEKESANET